MTNSGNFQEKPEEAVQADAQANVFDHLARAREISDLEQLRMAAVETGHAAYRWNVVTDVLTWSENASLVLDLKDNIVPGTGRAYQQLLPSSARDTRDELIHDNTQLDDGRGIEFNLSYKLEKTDEASSGFEIEERGKLKVDSNGEPREVFGFIRRKVVTTSSDDQAHFIDPETSLITKQGILSKLETHLAHNTEQTCGLIVASISNIKQIARTYGPVVVPEVVGAVAARLRSVMRGVDILGRSGAAQFAILLKQCSSEQIQVAGDRFISVIRDDVIETPHGPVWVEFCAGGIIMPNASSNPVEAFSFAEDALLRAESDASQCYVTHWPSPGRAETHKVNRMTAREIIEALNNERFTLWHQPIVRSDTGKPYMYESLLRMQSPEGDIISAAHLVPIATRLGFMHMIDAMVCRTSIDLIKARDDAIVSFNISNDTLNNAYACTRIQSLIAEAGPLVSNLCVEVSFDTINMASETAKVLLQNLRSMGCKIALSEYFTKGIGLDVLKSVDLVKLDGPVCAGISNRPGDLPLLKAAIEFAERAGADIIAEHIETNEDAALLSDIGVKFLQGYFFGEASPDYFNLTLSKLNEVDGALLDPAEPCSPDMSAAQLNALPSGDAIREKQPERQAEAPASVALEPAKAVEDNQPVCQPEEEPQKAEEQAKPELDLLKAALGKLDAI